MGDGLMISKDKTYRTKDGREVRIYATDGSWGGTIHGAVDLGGLGKPSWIAMQWTPNGMAMQWTPNGMVTDLINNRHDLIEVKPRHKRTVWINVYSDTHEVSAWHTKKHADNIAAVNRIACVEVDLDFEEGEGL